MDNRLFWRSPFRRSERLYLLDGACVTYDDSPGIVYQHGIVRDDFVIIEKLAGDFYDLPVGQMIDFSLVSEDDGLFSFIEVVFFKAGKRTSFANRKGKQLQVQVPDYDDLKIRVRVRGAGSTRLIRVEAQIASTEHLLTSSDHRLDDNLAYRILDKVHHSQDFLVTLSDNDEQTLPRYLLAESQGFKGMQLHFASKNGIYDLAKVRQHIALYAVGKALTLIVPDDLVASFQDMQAHQLLRLSDPQVWQD